MTESPRQSVKARRKMKQGDEVSSIASKYTMAIRQQREMMRPAISPSSPGGSTGVLSEEDMDQILSPTFSAEGSGQQPSVLSETNSADSIIRRVEQEIAAARKAAMHKNSNGSSEKKEDLEDDAADMANILNTNNSLDCNNNNDRPDDQQPPVLRTTSSSDSSKDRAMDMIRDEFQALEKEEEKQKNNESLSSQTSAAEPNPNTSTITTTSVAEPNLANTSKTSNESLSSLTPAAEPKVKTSTAPTKSDLYTKPVHIHLSYEQWQNQKRASATSSPVASSTTAEEKKIDSPAGVEKQGNNRFPPPQTPPRRTKGKDQTSDDNDKGAIPMDEARADKINDQWAPPLSVDPSSPPRPHRTPTPASRSSPSSRDGTPARNNLTSPRDPEGNYAVSPRTPPAVRPGMTRTRELLENLKEQRESIASRSVGSISTVSPTSAAPAGAASSPTMQRAAQLNFTRANRANEMTRGSPTAANLKEESPVEQEPQQQQQQQESSQQDAATDGATTNSRNPTAKRVTIKPPPTTEPGDKELISPRRTAREVAESISRQSYKIRFRNPFPVLKSPEVRRDPEAIIQDHSMGLPEMPVRWVRPKKELRQLIVAAMGTSLPRRSNACGALKVLTKNKKNQLTLARTDGFLGALIFAASQSIADADRDLAIDARTRAVTCLKNVCDPKDNRVIVFSHPGVVECLVKVLKSDTGEGRAMAAAAIAMLAKTPSCREGLARSEELVDVVSKVLQGAGCLMEDEEELSVPLCPSPKSHYSRKMDDSVSAFSDHSGGDDRDEDDEDDDEDRTDDDASASSLSSAEEPPTAVINARPVKHVDSIKNLTEERRNEFVRLARSNSCAALLHLSKQCAISYHICSSDDFLRSVLVVARESTNPIHTKCLEIITNLTRFPANNTLLTRYEGFVETLVAAAGNSPLSECRMAALRSLQNLSADPSSKTLLATGAVLNLLTSSAMRKDSEEKEVAVAALYNITTEPSAVTAITNTKNVVATLVHLAHSPDSSSAVRLLACEALATISLWLQTLAGTGKVPDGVTNVPLPSQKTTGWERWD